MNSQTQTQQGVIELALDLDDTLTNTLESRRATLTMLLLTGS